jgi:hypothetical protein
MKVSVITLGLLRSRSDDADRSAAVVHRAVELDEPGSRAGLGDRQALPG